MMMQTASRMQWQAIWQVAVHAACATGRWAIAFMVQHPLTWQLASASALNPWFGMVSSVRHALSTSETVSLVLSLKSHCANASDVARTLVAHLRANVTSAHTKMTGARTVVRWTRRPVHANARRAGMVTIAVRHLALLVLTARYVAGRAHAKTSMDGPIAIAMPTMQMQIAPEAGHQAIATQLVTLILIILIAFVSTGTTMVRSCSTRIRRTGRMIR